MSQPQRRGSHITSDVTVPTDAEGFFGRECPDPTCLAYFKLDHAEYPLARASGMLACPVCGTWQRQDSFHTRDQVRRLQAAGRELALGAVQEAIGQAFGGSGSRRGFTFRPAPPRSPRPLPTYMERQTIRTFVCPNGGHRAVIYDRLVACPYCGPATPVRAVLDDNLGAMRRLIEIVQRLSPEHRQEVEAAGGASAFAERALGGAVAAVQTFAKDLHSQSEREVTVRNPWQNPDRLREQWKGSFAVDPLDQLDDAQIALLRLGFARRHILEHNGGVADEKYLRESGDSVGPGRRVRFDADFVREFIDTVEALAAGLERGL
jgi:hypothetical protein